MRILWIDIDTLRPDHLGCYGYHRSTSPALDSIASQGIKFENCHVSDAPCLPSRSALISGKFGIHNGSVCHGGVAAEQFIEGKDRQFRSLLGQTSFMTCLRKTGLHTVSVSPFAERHSAWWWSAGFSEMHNTGKGGMETADEVVPLALDWLARNGKRDNWFLHVNVWDPHTPYRAPASFGNKFEKDPLPSWLNEEVRLRHWEGCGPHSAREVRGFGPLPDENRYPRQPGEIASMRDVRRLFDGYDTGIRYADDHAGRLIEALDKLGLLEDTAVIVSSDHGENLGELNIYGDHHTADRITTRVPLIVKWPGLKPRVDSGLLYQFDFAATLVELLGGEVPPNWDAVSFAPSFRKGDSAGRESLVVSQMAWTCQRAVRFEDYIYIRTYHDGYHCFPEAMLFDLANDPHEQRDLAPSRPDLRARAAGILDDWHRRMAVTAANPTDPLWTVLNEGGPYHTRGQLPGYLKRLRATGREGWADRLEREHPREAGSGD